MLREKWQGCVFILVLLLSNTSGTSLGEKENTIIPSIYPSDFARIVVQSKQTRQARVCGGADHRLLRSLANTGEEVMVTIPNSQLQHMAEFPEEARLWVAANVAPFLPATMITHVLAGDDVLSSVSPEGAAYALVPAMRNLHAAIVAAGLDGRVRVSTVLSAVPLAPSSSAGVAERVLRFLRETGSSLFLLKAHASEAEVADDARVDDAYAAMRALGFSGVPLIAADSEELGPGGALAYRSYLYHAAGGGGRRSLAAGTFCVALQNADPTALQAGLSWACGQGQADCSAVQPGGACYKQNNVAALASYAYNDYYQKSASTGATCSFNGTATTTATDPSSGSCVFAGSTMAGGGSTSNSSVPSASAPTSLGAPPSDALPPPPADSSPPSDFGPPAAGSAPPTSFDFPAGGFGPPSAFGSPPSAFGPPSGFGPPSAFGPPGSGTFGPSGTLEPYGVGCRHVASLAASTLLSAIVLAVLRASADMM